MDFDKKYVRGLLAAGILAVPAYLWWSRAKTADAAAPVAKRSYNILVGDIGGTNVRLKLYRFVEGLSPVEILPLTKFDSQHSDGL